MHDRFSWLAGFYFLLKIQILIFFSFLFFFSFLKEREFNYVGIIDLYWLVLLQLVGIVEFGLVEIDSVKIAARAIRPR